MIKTGVLGPPRFFLEKKSETQCADSQSNTTGKLAENYRDFFSRFFSRTKSRDKRKSLGASNQNSGKLQRLFSRENISREDRVVGTANRI